MNNLIQELKEIEIKPLSETQDSRYGNGKCSNFGLLEKTTNEIRQLKEDIVTLIKKEMKMLPYGLETNSFLNVFSKGAGQPIVREHKIRCLIGERINIASYTT